MTDRIKKFSELSADELYDILQLRNLVFAVEQNCIYPECDAYDKVALHFMLYENQRLIAYARILPPGSKYPQTSIGRVVVCKDHRGGGIGKIIMQKSIAAAEISFPEAPIIVQAQEYLQKFYQDLGFSRTSEPHDDHGIPHIYMVKT